MRRAHKISQWLLGLDLSAETDFTKCLSLNELHQFSMIVPSSAGGFAGRLQDAFFLLQGDSFGPLSYTNREG